MEQSMLKKGHEWSGLYWIGYEGLGPRFKFVRLRV